MMLVRTPDLALRMEHDLARWARQEQPAPQDVMWQRGRSA